MKLRAVLDAASQRLTLSHSPNAVADGEVIALPLAAIPFPSTVDDSIQHVTDVASWTDGTVAVLDRVQHHILILDRERAVVRTLGRQGNGPGEFQNPLALAASGDNIVVLDADPSRTFTLLARDGRVLATSLRPGAGDWAASYWREPDIGLEKPFHNGTEDWTRRLVGIDGASFFYLVADDERWFLVGKTTAPPSARIIRFTIPMAVADTIWTGSVPHPAVDRAKIVDRAGRPVQQQMPSVIEKLFRDRAMTAAGSGWTALRKPGEAVVIVNRDGGGTLAVSWPPGARARTASDVAAVAEKYSDKANRESAQASRIWRHYSSSKKKAYLKEVGEYLANGMLEDSLPEVTALYGAGRCLWIAGAAPRDHIDGTALTVVGVDVEDASTSPVVYRIARVDRRIRDISERGVITTYRDDDNLTHLEWNPFPTAGCTAPP